MLKSKGSLIINDKAMIKEPKHRENSYRGKN